MAAPALYEVHEDRIQRLEDNVTDVKMVQAAHTERLDRILAKIDSMPSLEPRVSALEKSEERRVSRTKLMLKVVGGALSSIIAALALIFLGIKK